MIVIIGPGLVTVPAPALRVCLSCPDIRLYIGVIIVNAGVDDGDVSAGVCLPVGVSCAMTCLIYTYERPERFGM